jgi:hypothetical protein
VGSRTTIPSAPLHVDHTLHVGDVGRGLVEPRRDAPDAILHVVQRTEHAQRAAVQDGHVIGHAFHVAEEMRAEQHRVAGFLDQLDHNVEELAPHRGVEPHGGIVEHDNSRIGRERERQRELRALSTRERADALRERKPQTIDARATAVPVEARERGRLQFHQLPARHPWHQLLVLGHVGHVGAHRRRQVARVVSEEFHATPRRRQESEQAADRRGLAGAIATEQRAHGAFGHVERNVMQHARVAVPVRDVVEADGRGHCDAPADAPRNW